MQPIDPNTLFNIFEQGDEQIYQEHGMEDQLTNPFVLMGMVLRGIDNYRMMDMMYLKQYPGPYKKVRGITKYKYYNKLYSYLTRIDSLNFNKVYKIGESFEIGEVYSCLDLLRVYYEEIEQYEKCAVIKKYIELLVEKGIKALT